MGESKTRGFAAAMLLGVGMVAAAAGCKNTAYRANFYYPSPRPSPTTRAQVDRQAAFVKLHLANGAMYLLEDWQLDDSAQTISGNGRFYAVAKQADLAAWTPLLKLSGAAVVAGVALASRRRA